MRVLGCRAENRQEGENRDELLPWSREAAVGVRAWAHERGKDQAMEATSGKGERGYNDSQIPNQDTAVSALWTGLRGRRGSSTTLQCLAAGSCKIWALLPC